MMKKLLMILCATALAISSLMFVSCRRLTIEEVDLPDNNTQSEVVESTGNGGNGGEDSSTTSEPDQPDDPIEPETPTFTITWMNGETTLATDTVAQGDTPAYGGAAPEKAEDEQYTYAFTGWDPEVAPVTGDATYTAQFAATVREYTITWMNGETTLATDTVAYGETPAYTGATPEKAADGQYTYAFVGWEPAVVAVTGDATYTAQFSNTANEYTITFLDAYGNPTAAAYAYGEQFTVPAALERQGYTFDGWALQVGENTYAAPETEIANKTVTAAATYCAMYTAVGPTYEKPALEKKVYSNAKDYAFVYGTGTQIWAEEDGTYFFEGAEFGQTESFVIYATVTADENDMHASQIGFVVGTLAENANHMLFQWRANDFYAWRSTSWTGHADNLFTPGYGTRTTQKTIALVYDNGAYSLYMNGVMVQYLPENGFTNGWGGTLNLKSQIGAEGTKKIGLSLRAGRMYCSDWGYSTDLSIVENYTKSLNKPFIGADHARAAAKGLQGATTYSNGTLSLRGGYYLAGAQTANGSDFMVQMTLTAVSGDIWFCMSDDVASGYGRIEYRMSNNKFYIYNYTSGTYRGVGWNWYDAIEERTNNASALSSGSSYTLTLVHKNGKYVVFIGDTKAVTFAETEELTMWGSKSNPVKHVSDIVGDGDTVYLGIGSINQTTSVSNWRFSTDPADINAYSVD